MKTRRKRKEGIKEEEKDAGRSNGGSDSGRMCRMENRKDGREGKERK